MRQNWNFIRVAASAGWLLGIAILHVVDVLLGR